MTTYTSVQSGNWTDPATWDVGSGYPGAGDTAIISSGHNVVVNADVEFDICRVDGTLSLGNGYSLTGNGSNKEIQLYGNIDWDYGGSGSEVYLQDLNIHLKTDTTTGGGGVTIHQQGNVKWYADLDDTPTGNLTRVITLSSGDTWTRTGTEEFCNNGNSSYRADLFIRSYGTMDYTGTLTTTFSGGTNTQRGRFFHFRGDGKYHNIDITEHTTDLVSLGYYYNMTITIEGDITVGSSAILQFQRYYSSSYLGDSVWIFGTATHSTNITNNGTIKFWGTVLTTEGNYKSIWRGYDGDHKVTITGNGVVWIVGSRDTDTIKDMEIQCTITTFENGTFEGDITIGDVSEVTGTMNINTDSFTAGHLTMNGGTINATDRDLTIGGIDGNGTLNLSGGSITGATMDLDNITYDIGDGIEISSCTNSGSNTIVVPHVKDAGSNTGAWNFGNLEDILNKRTAV